MLYKKIHRQLLRQFRVGRRYKWVDSNIVDFEVTREPFIYGEDIYVDHWFIINLVTGKIIRNIEWLEED